MTDPCMEYLHEDTNLLARWWGGEYIDIGYVDSEGEFHTQDCINVWGDHDEPTIPRTLEALKEEVDDWLG